MVRKLREIEDEVQRYQNMAEQQTEEEMIKTWLRIAEKTPNEVDYLKSFSNNLRNGVPVTKRMSE